MQCTTMLIMSNLILINCTTMLIIRNFIPMHSTTMFIVMHTYADNKQCNAQRCLL